MDRYYNFKQRLIASAKEDGDIKSVIAFGSSTRKEVKADEYSDLDLIIVTNEVGKWYSGEYPNRLGKVSISFVEPTLGGGQEYRCIYDENQDVDMIVLTQVQFEEALKQGILGFIMNRGFQVLYDEGNHASLVEQYVQTGHFDPTMTEGEFANTVNDFFFHNIWASKKLQRGELWSAKMCVDSYLKHYLLKMIEFYCNRVCGKDVWHDGRFIDTWAGEEITGELKSCFAHYDSVDVVAALRATSCLFERVTRGIAEKCGYAYPDGAAACAKKYLEKM